MQEEKQRAELTAQFQLQTMQLMIALADKLNEK
jgi:hypothetical protein